MMSAVSTRLRAAALRCAAAGCGHRAGGDGDCGNRRQPQRHGLRDDDRAAEPGPGADAGLAGLDRLHAGRDGYRGDDGVDELAVAQDGDAVQPILFDRF